MDFFTLVKARFNFLTEKQQVISINIANANTPEYEAKDIKESDFQKMLSGQNRHIALSTTSSAHFAGIKPIYNFAATIDKNYYEMKPDGNTVNLEQQAVKAAAISGDYAATTNLYRKMSSMLKIAVGGGGGQ